jgi:hypothetical protein
MGRSRGSRGLSVYIERISSVSSGDGTNPGATLARCRPGAALWAGAAALVVLIAADTDTLRRFVCTL